MKMTWFSYESTYRWHIFIPIVSHKDSFCHRGKSKLGIGYSSMSCSGTFDLKAWNTIWLFLTAILLTDIFEEFAKELVESSSMFITLKFPFTCCLKQTHKFGLSVAVFCSFSLFAYFSFKYVFISFLPGTFCMTTFMATKTNFWI